MRETFLLPRWVEDDSPYTAAPLLYGAGACCPVPFLNPFNFCSASYWQNKLKFVGCWPFNQNLAKGYISRALIINGYQAGISGGPPTTAAWAPFGCCLGKTEAPYPDCSFAFDISDEREYVTKGARLLKWPFNITCVYARTKNHLVPFLLWMLYKGAYQNKFRTNGNTVSQYVPKVTP